MLLLAPFLIIILCLTSTINAQNACSLDVSTTDLIILDQSYKIRLPATNKTEISLRYQEKLLIRCPSGSITPLLSDDGENTQCDKGTILQILRNTRYIDFSSIKCVQKLPATLKISDAKCHNGGTDVQIGLEMLNVFTVMYTVCFDQKQLVPVNATFNVPIDQWGAFSSETTDHYFVDDGHLYPDVDLDALYERQDQIFTNWGLPEYHTNESFLIKGQLLPSYLFSYSLEKYAAFNYANVVPQWSTLRNVFAEFVNNFVSERGINATVYQVGTLDVATLQSSQKGTVKLFLGVSKTIPVPRWLWFTQPDSFTIYGFNNPYYEEADVEAEFKELCMLPFSFEKFKDMLVGVCGGDPNV